MKQYRTRALAAVAAGIMLSAAAVPAASARTTGPQSARPDTSVTSCVGSHWLKLTGSLGPTCYTGNGNIIVNLPGVGQEQIVGNHTVCLFGAGGHQISCRTGAGTVKITPPVQVSEITIRNP